MDLTDKEKAEFVEAAVELIDPIAQKYELDDRNGRAALIEAFQAGIQFFYQRTMNKGDHDGRDNN